MRTSTLKIIHWSFSWSDVFANSHSSALAALLSTSSTYFSEQLLLKLFPGAPDTSLARVVVFPSKLVPLEPCPCTSSPWWSKPEDGGPGGTSSTSALLGRKEKSGPPSLGKGLFCPKLWTGLDRSSRLWAGHLGGGRLLHLGAYWWVLGVWRDHKQEWIESSPCWALPSCSNGTCPLELGPTSALCRQLAHGAYNFQRCISGAKIHC